MDAVYRGREVYPERGRLVGGSEGSPVAQRLAGSSPRASRKRDDRCTAVDPSLPPARPPSLRMNLGYSTNVRCMRTATMNRLWICWRYACVRYETRWR